MDAVEMQSPRNMAEARYGLARLARGPRRIPP